MDKSYYQKFVGKKKNSAVKEGFKQVKRKAKKERAAAIDKRFEDKRQMQQAIRSASLEATDPSNKKPFRAKPDNIEKATPLKVAAPDTKAFAKAAAPKVATPAKASPRKNSVAKTGAISNALMPLNKYLAHCGVCSRRDAVVMVKEGKVKVNNEIILEPAFKVTDKDEVICNGKALFVSKNLVYILVNKPKDYITTTDDPQGRKTVLQLTKMATTERIYPVGRLDRNTSGVLLLTNDGELTQKLSHPSYNITKVYEVKLDKDLTKNDFEKILSGLTLEDGLVTVDSLAYADSRDKSVIGIEIHSGRNRIVRRIFESLGYDVKGLDRVMYANLTKKNVERGKWRFLSEKEVRLLKYMNASYKTKPANAAKNSISKMEEAADNFEEELLEMEDAKRPADKKQIPKKKDFKKEGGNKKDAYNKTSIKTDKDSKGFDKKDSFKGGKDKGKFDKKDKFSTDKKADYKKADYKKDHFKTDKDKAGFDKSSSFKKGDFKKDKAGSDKTDSFKKADFKGDKKYAATDKPDSTRGSNYKTGSRKTDADKTPAFEKSSFNKNRDKLKIAQKRPVKK
jgi:23S rRNA pseudouridine2605 synthase